MVSSYQQELPMTLRSIVASRALVSLALAAAALVTPTVDANALLPCQTGSGGEPPIPVATTHGRARISTTIQPCHLTTHLRYVESSINRAPLNQAVHAPPPHAPVLQAPVFHAPAFGRR
jgi:hypothetical protein